MQRDKRSSRSPGRKKVQMAKTEGRFLMVEMAVDTSNVIYAFKVNPIFSTSDMPAVYIPHNRNPPKIKLQIFFQRYGSQLEEWC